MPICEAILITSDSYEGSNRKAGQLCSEVAVGKHNGFNVCWVHLKACENVDRKTPVQLKRRNVRL